jgi:hypothetical protein
MTRQTIWINRTTSFNWNRPVVGIVRVETELSEQLHKLYPEGVIKECIWDGDKFIELHNRISITEKKSAPVANKITPRYLFPVISKKQAIFNIAQGIFSILPTSLRSSANRILTRIKPYIVKSICRYIIWRNKKSLKNIEATSLKNTKARKTADDIYSNKMIFLFLLVWIGIILFTKNFMNFEQNSI